MTILARLLAPWLIICSFPFAAAAIEPVKGPYYDPASKSYFQLFSDNLRPGNWAAARERAEQKIYKGVRGRLAHVMTPETHNFLVEKFGLNRPKYDVWIGLRYWCQARLLQWGTERPFEPSDADHFRVWLSPWDREHDNPGGSCGMHASKLSGFVPVYYTAPAGFAGWRASGSAKFYDYYIVEYPTGEQ